MDFLGNKPVVDWFFSLGYNWYQIICRGEFLWLARKLPEYRYPFALPHKYKEFYYDAERRWPLISNPFTGSVKNHADFFPILLNKSRFISDKIVDKNFWWLLRWGFSSSLISTISLISATSEDAVPHNPRIPSTIINV